MKHELHVRDAGGAVPAQGLVEGVRVLPRVRKQGIRAGREAREAAGGGAVCARIVQRRGHDCRYGGTNLGRREQFRSSTREKRTWNM